MSICLRSDRGGTFSPHINLRSVGVGPRRRTVVGLTVRVAKTHSDHRLFIGRYGRIVSGDGWWLWLGVMDAVVCPSEVRCI